MNLPQEKNIFAKQARDLCLEYTKNLNKSIIERKSNFKVDKELNKHFFKDIRMWPTSTYKELKITDYQGNMSESPDHGAHTRTLEHQ